ncbi:DUF3939 domain-containing protein [Calidifontibacillus oryziterrae]|uniref:DUF3939 domain-containing protein n=1 Tax=Calidifontibacillus oryziterrae TaxID=1191699 RepID=UPI0002FFD113|nr:DUF3939 domain-containing protein [Calidifontibacillus oryziterrae]
MWKKWTKKKSNQQHIPNSYNNDNIIEVDLDTIKAAVRKFAENAPPGVTTKVLVKDDHSIDFNLLKPFLNGIPNKTFYMSKETYEVFEEKDKAIPLYIDKVQQAVDRYVDMYKKLPTIPDDPYQKVSYLMLENNSLLTERPPIDFYITNEEYLVTYKRPK